MKTSNRIQTRKTLFGKNLTHGKAELTKNFDRISAEQGFDLQEEPIP